MVVGCGNTRIRNKPLNGTSVGTAGCLLRPASSPTPLYLLTASHVVAPERFGTKVGDAVVDDQGNEIGRVAAATVPSVDGIDAAIVELSVEATSALGSLGVPTGWGNLFWNNMEIRAHGATSGPISGTVADDNESMPVSYSSPSGPFELTLASQVACNMTFNGGDSGAVAINPFGNVVGLVVANSGGHGVVTPILTVLAALRARGFDLVPVVERPPVAAGGVVGQVLPPPEPATVPTSAQINPMGSAPWSGALFTGRPTLDDINQALDILAWTLWAEAAVDYDKFVAADGSRIREKAFRAVAEVVVRRVNKPQWWGRSIETVCQSHATDKKMGGPDVYQFSCWDPMGMQIKQIRSSAARALESYRAAEWTARNIIAGWNGTLTNGAFHYFANYLPTPDWARGHTPCVTVGQHHFFNDIA